MAAVRRFRPVILVVALCLVACLCYFLLVRSWKKQAEQHPPPLPRGRFVRSVDSDQSGKSYSGSWRQAPRVMCLVVTSPQLHQRRASHVKATWGHWGRGACPNTVFLTSTTDDALNNVILSEHSRLHELSFNMDSREKSQSQKRSSDTSTDWTLCVFCQKKDPKKPTRNLGDAGIQRVREAAAKRKKYNDSENLHTVERIQDIDFEGITKQTDVLNHKDCYSTFTSSFKITRLRAKYESTRATSSSAPERSSSPRPSLRSKLSIMDIDLCIFCQERSSKQTYLVATFEVSDKILQGAQTDPVMRCRLAGVSDLVAAHVRYHLQCYVQFNRKASKSSTSTAQTSRDTCFEKVASEVSTGLARGEIYTLLDVWGRYSSLLSEFGIEAGPYRDNKFCLKEKLHRLLPGQIDFVPQLDPHQPQLLFSTLSAKTAVQTLKRRSDEMETKRNTDDLRPTQFSHSETDELLTLHHCALRIRGDINSRPGLDNCTSVSKKSAEKVVPESLFLFLSILLSGEVDGQADDNFVKRTALSISQDLVYAVSKHKKLTPKHVGPFPAVYLKLTQCQCKDCESHRCSCRLKELRCTAGCGCADGTCRNPLNSAQDDSD